MGRTLGCQPVGSVPCDAGLYEFEDFVQLPALVVGVSCHDGRHFVLEGIADVGVTPELRPVERFVDVGPRPGEALVEAAGNFEAVDLEFEPCAEVVQMPDVRLFAERGHPIDVADVFGIGIAESGEAGRTAVFQLLFDRQRQIPPRVDMVGEIFGDRDLRRAAYDRYCVLDVDVRNLPDEVRREQVAVFDHRSGPDFGDREFQPFRVFVEHLLEDILPFELRLDRFAVHEIVGCGVDAGDDLFRQLVVAEVDRHVAPLHAFVLEYLDLDRTITQQLDRIAEGVVDVRIVVDEDGRGIGFGFVEGHAEFVGRDFSVLETVLLRRGVHAEADENCQKRVGFHG